MGESTDMERTNWISPQPAQPFAWDYEPASDTLAARVDDDRDAGDDRHPTFLGW